MKTSTPKKLTDFKFLNLFSIGWENRGKKGEWIYASRKAEPKPGPKPLKEDAVVVAAVHVAPDGERRLVVIKEYRMPIGDYEYAFVAGLSEGTPSEDAERELAEETGLTLDKITHISPPIVSSAGLSDESVVMVFCECHGKVNLDGNHATEEIEVCLLNYKEVCNLCNNKDVKIGAKTWPVLFMIQQLGKI